MAKTLAKPYLHEPNLSDNRPVYTVSDLNSLVKSQLECEFNEIWITGEISNFACPSSGHWYFSLKDERSQLRCVLFRNYQAHLDLAASNGMQVLLRGQLSLYTVRGDYQCIVTHMIDAGLGRLQRAFDALKKQLSSEGLFAAKHKQTLPAQVQRIGLITSPTGAAIRDVLSVLARRSPHLHVILYASQVQGENAAKLLVQAINHANHHHYCDVLLLVRGGGTLEDLWPFNEEAVARAIVASKLPIITGIGHEIDVSIADFTADFRAATPSAAAELASTDSYILLRHAYQQRKHLALLLSKKIQEQRQILQTLAAKLQHPNANLQLLAQKLDQLELRLQMALQQQLNKCRQSYQINLYRLQQQLPNKYLKTAQLNLTKIYQRLHLSMNNHYLAKQQKFQSLAQQLQLLNPLATLDRGYAIAKYQDRILTSQTQIKKGEQLKLRLAKGQLLCEVKDKIS